MGLVRAAMAQHGTVVFSKDQTKGKGQRNRQWVTLPGQNIAMSVIAEPSALSVNGLFILSMAMAVGSIRFLKQYIPDDVSIKWPNDLYWRDRKAGGILIENLWHGTFWKYAIVGIGININQTDFGVLLQKAVSLKQITGKEFDPVTLAKELCVDLDHAFIQAVEDPEMIQSEYRKHLYKLQQVVKLKKGNRVFEATIKEVNANGQLVVQHATEEIFDVGEVAWLV